jgi:hypothetical protein
MDIGLFVPDVLSELNSPSVEKPLKHKRKYFKCKQTQGEDLWGGGAQGCIPLLALVNRGGCKGGGKKSNSEIWHDVQCFLLCY